MKKRIGIVRTKGICGGEPRIDGTRLTVVGVLSFLANGMSVEKIIKLAKESGTIVSKESVLAAIHYSASLIKRT